MSHDPDFEGSASELPQEVAGAGATSAATVAADDLRDLGEVVAGTAAGTGREFFCSLVRHLAEAIGVHHAVVAEFPKAPPHVRTIAFWEGGRVADNFEYDFTGTPCAEIVRGGLVHYPTGVSRLFPLAGPLVERGIDSYMAVPFLDGAGNILGHLAVFDARPMPAEPRRVSFFKIFAARATAELQRLRTEHRLSESEARYRDLYENAPCAYLIVGADGRILAVNRRLTEMIGYSTAEMIGASVHSFMPDTPAGKSRSLEVFRLHQAGEFVSGWEMELSHKDGRPVWIKLWMEPTCDEDGTIQGSRSFCVDITDQVLVEQERARLKQQNLYLQEEIKSEHDCEHIVGRSSALAKVLAEVRRVAPTDTTVLITGETGTGKELVARAIHSASRRKDKPLIKVNCAALPAGLIESELFGHEKGAFSGAIARRLGRFELADGGTIFLDEVGELPLEAQSKLLRTLQEREIDRVGGTVPVKVDVRVIAATNRDLLAEVREKRFREDLNYRLNVFPVHLPPLRQRRDDIPVLVHFLLGKLAPRVGKPLEGVTQATMQRLQQYAWPGNIRELENVLERAVILATGPTIEIAADILPSAAPVADAESPGPDDIPHVTGLASTPPGEGQLHLSLEAVERDHILAVLNQTNWLITGPRGAARILGLHANTLRNRMKRLGITRPAH